jgi:hypothetical protein
MAEMLQYCVTTPLSGSKTTPTFLKSEKRGNIVYAQSGPDPYTATYHRLVYAVAFKHLVAFKKGCFIKIVVPDSQACVKV